MKTITITLCSIVAVCSAYTNSINIESSPNNALLASIEGAVINPISLEIDKPIGLRALLERAGGLHKNANPKKIEIHRQNGETEVVDITKLGPIARVCPGDLVFVKVLDESQYVSVSGAVVFPGLVEYNDNLTLAKVLKESEIAKNSDLQKVKVVRNTDEGEKLFIVNLTGENAESNLVMALNAGDRVEVPYKSMRAASDRELITIIVIGLLILLLVK
jgi:protein involved in polysaccharide export with SLBB domain